jgi:Mycobacterium membrane protein
VAQGDSGSIGCRSAVDGVFDAETISDELDALTVCLLEAA